jgi:hypothetical protein
LSLVRGRNQQAPARVAATTTDSGGSSSHSSSHSTRRQCLPATWAARSACQTTRTRPPPTAPPAPAARHRARADEQCAVHCPECARVPVPGAGHKQAPDGREAASAARSVTTTPLPPPPAPRLPRTHMLYAFAPPSPPPPHPTPPLLHTKVLHVFALPPYLIPAILAALPLLHSPVTRAAHPGQGVQAPCSRTGRRAWVWGIRRRQGRRAAPAPSLAAPPPRALSHVRDSPSPHL